MCLGRQLAAAEAALIAEPWFIATLIVVIGAVVWTVLCLFSVWIYRRHKAGKKIPKNRARPGQLSYVYCNNATKARQWSWGKNRLRDKNG